jgi:glycoside/pentoside/hexuronide:cation symporter, GPH family
MHILPRSINPVHASWGLGSLGTIAAIASVSNLYLFFMVSVLGVAPALAGALIFLSKAFDVVTDPLMGYLSDRTKTKSGRRRPWLLLGSVLSGLSVGLLFSVGLTGTDDKVSLVAITALLFFHAAATTIFNVPYLAMPAEMTEDYHERSTLMSYRALFLVGGSFVGNSLAGVIIRQSGGGVQGYATMGWVMGGVVFVAMLICWAGTAKARTTSFEKPTMPPLRQMQLLFVNKPFLVLALLKALQFLQLASAGGSLLFFLVNIMDRNEASLLPYGLGVSSATLLFLPLWLRIGRRIGKRPALTLSLCLYILVHLSWLFAAAGEPDAFLVLRAIGTGTFAGGVVVFSQSMILDVIAYDRKISGISREGLFSSLFSFIEKTTYALGPLLIGLLLSAFGFVGRLPEGQSQSETALIGIRIALIGIPFIANVGMLVCLHFFRLDETQLADATLHPLAAKGDPAP